MMIIFLSYLLTCYFRAAIENGSLLPSPENLIDGGSWRVRMNIELQLIAKLNII